MPLTDEFIHISEEKSDLSSTTTTKPVIPSSQSNTTPINNQNEMPAEIADITEYYAWIIVLAVFTGVIPAIPNILLCLLTRKLKRQGKAKSAKISSRFTLATNLFLTTVLMCAAVYGVTLRTENY